MQKTHEHALQGINPGGYYQAIWCRDASYILRDWSLSGNLLGSLQQLYFIWSHQIEPGREKLVYGRGSPAMEFLSQEAKKDKQQEFAGALPTTIYQAGFSEVYAASPDIDSTALMISTTSKILLRALQCRPKDQASGRTVASANSADYVSSLLLKLGITDPAKATEFIVPKMLRAVEYLAGRDIDNDGLLEQGENEDWMDTVLRSGKTVYSQACWILALKNLAALLQKIDQKNDLARIISMCDRAIDSVEAGLWSEENCCYTDELQLHHIGGPYNTLTQDVCLYLVALTENTARDNIDGKAGSNPKASLPNKVNANRAKRALDEIKARLWQNKWPLVTETELLYTGPWVLKPYQYHNHTFWPWTTGIEMLARSRFDRVQECDRLLSTLASGRKLHMHTFYEWIDPTNGEGNGAFPFRTGISAVRVAVNDIFGNIQNRTSV